MKLFRDVLRTAGYDTFEATTGQTAVEVAVEHEPDVVLVRTVHEYCGGLGP